MGPRLGHGPTQPLISNALDAQAEAAIVACIRDRIEGRWGRCRTGRPGSDAATLRKDRAGLL